MTIDGYLAIPLTKLEHVTCFAMMSCSICAHRCYEGAPGHYFKDINGSDSGPCDCGFFKTIKAAEEYYAIEEEMKDQPVFVRLFAHEAARIKEWWKQWTEDMRA